MSKAMYFIPVVVCIFSSCSTNSDISTPVEQNPVEVKQEATLPTQGTGSLEDTLTSGQSNTDKKQESTKTTGFNTVESLDSIKTLDDLKTVNPFIGKLPGSEHPKFVELQKKQMKMGILMSELKDPQLLSLREKQMAIYQGKELWSSELKKIDADFTVALANIKVSTGESVNDSIKTILDKKNQLMKEFQVSKEYQEYIESQQSKIAELNEAISKFYSPEILALQKEVQDLNIEIYSQKSTQSAN